MNQSLSRKTKEKQTMKWKCDSNWNYVFRWENFSEGCGCVLMVNICNSHYLVLLKKIYLSSNKKYWWFRVFWDVLWSLPLSVGLWYTSVSNGAITMGLPSNKGCCKRKLSAGEEWQNPSRRSSHLWQAINKSQTYDSDFEINLGSSKYFYGYRYSH